MFPIISYPLAPLFRCLYSASPSSYSFSIPFPIQATYLTLSSLSSTPNYFLFHLSRSFSHFNHSPPLQLIFLPPQLHDSPQSVFPPTFNHLFARLLRYDWSSQSSLPLFGVHLDLASHMSVSLPGPLHATPSQSASPKGVLNQLSY